jgi:plasmid stability protein
MATLYIEDIPEELYEALRRRARERRRSMAAEVLALLEENIPTAKETQGAPRGPSEARDGALFCSGTPRDVTFD